jgi:trk system potassium uptake protein TrkA
MGGGKVGAFLAEALDSKGNRVAVIERSQELCERLANKTSAVIIHGDGCDLRYQEEAKTYFNVPRTVARVNNPKNEPIFNKLGVDAISSTTVIAQLIEERTTVGDIITLHTLKKGKLAVVELDLPEDRCRSCEVPLRDLGLPFGCVLVSIIRGEEVVIPQGGSMLQPGDTVIAVTEPEKEGELKRILTGE